jgi:hypothetical protein
MISCLSAGVQAMSSYNYPPSNSASDGGGAVQWSLSPDGAIAYGKLYVIDLEQIAYLYEYIRTGNESQKLKFSILQTDVDGSVNRLLDQLDRMVEDHPDVKSDYLLLYDSWDRMNLSAMKAMSSFDTTGSPVLADLSEFEMDAINLTDTFDTFIGRYYDPGNGDEKTLRLYMFADLAGAINAETAYGLTDNSLQKMVFIRKMIDFDKKADLYEMLYPGHSVDDLKDIKYALDNAVAKKFKTIDAGEKLSEEDQSHIIGIISQVRDGYRDLAGDI